MCESNAYMKKNGEEQLLLENVTYIKPDGSTIIMSSLLGDEIRVEGKIVEIDLMAHKVVLAER